MESIWQKTADLPTFPTLENDIKTDVLIIGGGLAGILTAYKLREKGVNCIVVEKDRICQKVTGNTTAKITSQHGFCYSKILKSNGFESAKIYLHANEQALREYEKLCENIQNCEVADERIRYVHGSSVGFVAEGKIKNGEEPINSANLIPFYLRLPQAERELKLKK